MSTRGTRVVVVVARACDCCERERRGDDGIIFIITGLSADCLGTTVLCK